MKFKFDKKYLGWGVTAFITLCLVILFTYLIFNTSKLADVIKNFFNAIMPIIFGLVMAYLLTPICGFFERLLSSIYKKLKYDPENKKMKKNTRTFAIIFTMMLTIFLIYKFFSVVLGEVIVSIESIITQSPQYVNNMEELLDRFLSRNPDIEKMANDLLNTYSKEINDWLNNTILPRATETLKNASIGLFGAVKVLWNLVIGFIVSIYVLASRETFAGQAKKIIYSIFEPKNANEFVADLRYANKVFGSYLSGKIIDSVIIGFLCFIIMSIFKLPYAVLISLIIGVTNIIPFFGPFLGAIPSVILILMISPVDALKFAVIIVLLQQFDGNILGPKILGDSTGLSSFWIIFSITLFGAYFGVIGMAIGVPIFALIYAFIKRKVNRSLTKRGLTTNTDEYVHLEYVEDGKIYELSEEKKLKSRKPDHKKTIYDRLRGIVNKKDADEK